MGDISTGYPLLDAFVTIFIILVFAWVIVQVVRAIFGR